jgi:Tat protein secretion system quality control protein TatD with DNase activity
MNYRHNADTIDSMKFIDTHCHMDFKDYDADREEVIRRTSTQAGE